MSTLPELTHSGVITEHQTALIGAAEQLYAARATTQLAHMAEALGLTEDQSAQLLGMFALVQDKLDFERLRIVGASAEVIGEVATGGEVLGVGREFPATAQSTVTVESPASVKEPEVKNDLTPTKNVEESLPADKQEEKEPAPYPLGKTQRAWMGKIYDEEYVSRIEHLTPEKQLQLVHAIAKRYRGLSVRRLTSDNKKLRSKQLIDLFEGRTLEEIGQDSDISAANVRAALGTMAGTISKNISPSTRKRMLPRAGTRKATSDTSEDIAGNNEKPKNDKPSNEVDTSGLTDIQQAWFQKVFEGKAAIKEIALDSKKAEALVASLEEYIYLCFINRGGEDGVKRRCEQITFMLLGFDAEKIATITLTSLAETKAEIEETADVLSSELDDTTRSNLLDKALE